MQHEGKANMHNRPICSHKVKHLLGIIKTESNIIGACAPLPSPLHKSIRWSPGCAAKMFFYLRCSCEFRLCASLNYLAQRVLFFLQYEDRTAIPYLHPSTKHPRFPVITPSSQWACRWRSLNSSLCNSVGLHKMKTIVKISAGSGMHNTPTNHTHTSKHSSVSIPFTGHSSVWKRGPDSIYFTINSGSYVMYRSKE